MSTDPTPTPADELGRPDLAREAEQISHRVHETYRRTENEDHAYLLFEVRSLANVVANDLRARIAGQDAPQPGPATAGARIELRNLDGTPHVNTVAPHPIVAWRCEQCSRVTGQPMSAVPCGGCGATVFVPIREGDGAVPVDTFVPESATVDPDVEAARAWARREQAKVFVRRDQQTPQPGPADDGALPGAALIGEALAGRPDDDAPRPAPAAPDVVAAKARLRRALAGEIGEWAKVPHLMRHDLATVLDALDRAPAGCPSCSSWHRMVTADDAPAPAVPPADDVRHRAIEAARAAHQAWHDAEQGPLDGHPGGPAWLAAVDAALDVAIPAVPPADGEEPRSCATCADSTLACENHPDRPWDGVSTAANPCGCGPGIDCPTCSTNTTTGTANA